MNRNPLIFGSPWVISVARSALGAVATFAVTSLAALQATKAAVAGASYEEALIVGGITGGIATGYFILHRLGFEGYLDRNNDTVTK